VLRWDVKVLGLSSKVGGKLSSSPMRFHNTNSMSLGAKVASLKRQGARNVSNQIEKKVDKIKELLNVNSCYLE
ncbi:hypothetical protein S245_049060, partial [Arachis hypogaea]